MRRLALLGGTPQFAAPLYVTRPRMPALDTFSAYVRTIFESRWLTNDGSFVRDLETRLQQRLGVEFVAPVCNATVGLLVALRSLDLTGEVITTPFTFPATAHAIEWSGLRPVFCDIDPVTYNLDVNSAANVISSQTSAILPVHVFGNPCDVDAIDGLAARHSLKVVYDAAHAFGVRHRGRGIGEWGDLSVFSFHATKLFHTAEGGAIVGRTAALLSRIVSLRNFAIVNEEVVRGVGINGKMSELHAAMGVALLQVVDDEIAARAERTRHYRARFADLPGIITQRLAPDTVVNHAYLPIEVDPDTFGLTRDELAAVLRAENIVARKYFYPLCTENDAYRFLASAQRERLPHASRLASRVMCLPLYGDLPISDVDAVCDAIRDARTSARAVRVALGGNA